jgi:hypothetical protein
VRWGSAEVAFETEALEDKKKKHWNTAMSAEMKQ